LGFSSFHVYNGTGLNITGAEVSCNTSAIWHYPNRTVNCSNLGECGQVPSVPKVPFTGNIGINLASECNKQYPCGFRIDLTGVPDNVASPALEVWLLENNVPIMDIYRGEKWDEIDGFVNFNEPLPHYSDSCPLVLTHKGYAFGRSVIHSPQDTEATITFGYLNDGKIWLNGEDLTTTEHNHFRSESIDVKLRKGKNEVIVRLTNGGVDGGEFGMWTMAFNVRLPDGTLLRPECE